MNILLFVHIVIAVLLIIVILMQKTGTDGLSGIGGGGGGVVTGRTVANFLTKTTVILATLFIINALVLANLSSRKNPEITKKIEQSEEKGTAESLPMAK